MTASPIIFPKSKDGLTTSDISLLSVSGISRCPSHLASAVAENALKMDTVFLKFGEAPPPESRAAANAGFSAPRPVIEVRGKCGECPE